MNVKKTLLSGGLIIAGLLLATTASAYTPEEQEKMCKKPKFTDFNLTEYTTEQTETAPEAELMFKVPAWTDASTIKLTAKKLPLAFSVESNSSFHKIKAKLPPELTGQFVRINVSAKAMLGCHSEDGWLIKVAEKK